MKYTIDTTRVSDEANRMNDIANSITNASDTLNGIIGANALCTDSGRMIMRSLMSVKKELDANAGKTKKYAGALSDIAALYGNAEKKAMGNAEFKAKNKYTKTEKKLMKFGAGAWGFASGLGIVEMGKAALGPINDCIDLAKDLSDPKKGIGIDALSDTSNIVGDLKDLGEKVREGGWTKALKETFGLYVEKDPKPFKEAVLGDYFKVSDDCESSKIGTNWAGAILDSAVSNIKENGFTDRAAEETIVEAGLSVGKNIVVNAAATALVGAACGAIGVAGAPVIVTTIAAAGVGFAFDKAGDAIARQVTGDPKAEWMECVSDTVCDTVNKALGPVGNSLGEAGHAVVKKAGSAVQWIGSQLSPICVS